MKATSLQRPQQRFCAAQPYFGNDGWLQELVKRNALTVFKKADDVDRAGGADK